MEFGKGRLLVAQFGNEEKFSRHNIVTGNLSCISEHCERLVSEYNCSCLKKSFPTRICRQNVDSTIPVVLTSISASIMFLLILELFFIRCKRSFFGNFFTKFIFSMGIVSSLVTQLCTTRYIQESSDGIILWYDVALGGISMVFICFGYCVLFKKSKNANIGSHDRGMGFVVVFISILVVGLEIGLVTMVFLRENPDVAIAFDLNVYAFQTIVQALFYTLMRRCNPDPDFKRGTALYFYFLAFLNFTFWLNCIRFTDIQIYDEVSHSPILQYVVGIFKALVIDYRLLCTLQFFEHATAIDESDENTENNENNEHAENQRVHSRDDQKFQLPGRRKLYTAIGIGIGLVLLSFEVISSIKFWHGGFPDYVCSLPILADIIVVVVGWFFWRNVKKTSGSHIPHIPHIPLALRMVTSMGATSIVYLYCFGIFCFTSFKNDEPVSYVRWSAFIYIARATSLLVLLHVYIAIPVSEMESRENYNKKNYILVSALCTGLFARVVGSITDEFKGTMHDIAHAHMQASELRILQDLFVIGPLFQLAASLHLALHFSLMLCRLHEQPNIVSKEMDNLPLAESVAVGKNYGTHRDVDGQPIGDHGAVRVEDPAFASAQDAEDDTIPLLRQLRTQRMIHTMNVQDC